LALKGVTRSGEAYCLSCHQMVEREATRCEGCLSELTEEVKAFSCPKCKTVIALGDTQCSSCGLRFKVRSVKPKDSAKDDQFLMNLIEWGKAPGESRAESPTPALETGTPAGPAEEPAQDKVRHLAQLKESVKELMANRSEMLERMERRIENEKARLAQISDMDDESSSAEQVEAEIMSLADEMADITMLQAHMESLSDEISSLLESVDVSEPVKERGLAARALRKKLDAKEKEVAELKAKEDQIAVREEMVNRKIQGYAQKKKQLDDLEEKLKTKLESLEGERQDLERLKAVAGGASTESEREQASAEWLEDRDRLRQKLLGIRSTVTLHRSGKETPQEEIDQTEVDLESMISELEREIGALIAEKTDLQSKMNEASLLDEDMKKLLKVLDQMLGQLPEESIERFSKSDEFAVYERILDKFKI
jgi:chromosome segregation ATPase